MEGSATTSPDSAHVTTLGLATATDKDVWDHAGEHGYTIVSRDSDFRQLAFLHGPPPKVIWLRVGNVTTATALEMLIDHYEVIEAFENAAEEADRLDDEVPVRRAGRLLRARSGRLRPRSGREGHLVHNELKEANGQNYRDAARRLAKMRKLAARTDKTGDVDNLISDLRDTYRHRPRLQQEFDRAGLP